MTFGKFGIFTFAAAALLAPCLTGCAEEEYDAREVAYPQPIGYTTPPSQVAASQVPAAPQPQPAAEVEGEPGDVVVGDEEAAPQAGQPMAADEYSDTDPSAVTDFRQTLDPYGSWVEDPTYGTVWVPSSTVVGSDFTPYVSAGHWDYDDDYTWVSDYDWGWAPFHYGRWVYAGGYGWEWIPGRAYAGAWVSWRYGWDDWAYVGWAPLGPTWCWRGGRAYGLGFVPRAPYAFVSTGNLFAPGIGGRLVTGSQVGVIASHTRPWVGANPGVGGSGRVAANPRVGGPPPQMLHIPQSGIAHATASNRGVVQARAFARPSTAAAMGARAPVGYASRGPVASGYSSGLSRAPSSYGRAPAYGAAAPSHFGGRMGSGFSGSVNSQRPSYYRGPSSGYSSGYSSGSAGGARPYYGTTPSYHGAPAYRGYSGGYAGPSGGGFGGYHGPTGVAPSGGSHGHSGYSGGAGFGGVHSGGGFRGGGGGGGGFHGGGGGGGRGGGGHR